MININLHPRDLKAKNPQSIWAVFHYEKNKIKINTNQFVNPKDWSRSQQKTLTSHLDYAKVNKLLKEKKEKIEELAEQLLNKLQREKKRFFKDVFQIEIQDKFNINFKIGQNKPKKEDEVVDFISFIDKYIASRKDLALGSQKILKGTRKHILLGFNLLNPKMIKQWNAMSNYQRKLNPLFLEPSKQIDFDEINYDWFVEFNTYLLNATFTEKIKGVLMTKPYSKNYIAKQIKTTQNFCNEAVKSGKLHNLSFKGFKAGKEEADSVFLDWSEIENIKALEFAPDSLKGKVRNLFIFNCYCGLRYSDLRRLDENRFAKDKSNQLYLKIRMKKVDEIVMFPILKSAEDIMKIYNYKLPAVVEPKYNIEIKKICQMAGINGLETKRETRGGCKIILTMPKYEMVASHTARRSFATNFFEDNVPLTELMAVTGHTTEAAFKNYVKDRKEKKFTKFLEVGANR